jgi:hypothetical protein
MKCLKEPLSRLANRQDKTRGTFFESRFKSVAILDEEALLAISVYIYAGRLIRQGKASISAELAGIFERLNCNAQSWHKRMRGSAGIDCWAVSLRPPEPSCGRLANASVFGTWSTLRVVHFDDTNVIRGPHRAVGSSPRRVESLRLRTHSWSMLGEIRLDPSPQPDKNG